jgi:regulator of replication initiation timing
LDKKNLEDKLKELDEKIAEVNNRLPAHSVKPPIMTELFALEDERDAIRQQLEALEQGGAMQNLNKNKGEQ